MEGLRGKFWDVLRRSWREGMGMGTALLKKKTKLDGFVGKKLMVERIKLKVRKNKLRLPKREKSKKLEIFKRKIRH